MANTYTQIHIHCVFAVKYRASVIRDEWKQRLYSYITAIVQNNGHKMLCINGMPDHLHMFFGLNVNQSVSDLMRIVKGESSEWINLQKFNTDTFRWQEGYGGFSYSRSQVKKVCNYIENQEEHHRKKTFLEEYVDMLKAFGIDYKANYLFKNLSEVRAVQRFSTGRIFHINAG
ncbi:IS200/IS605 family transposase [soil metagenome]